MEKKTPPMPEPDLAVLLLPQKRKFRGQEQTRVIPRMANKKALFSVPPALSGSLVYGCSAGVAEHEVALWLGD